jgi:hypothetical protein
MPLLSPLADLYSDYLIVNQGQATATELSSLVEGNYSHDSVTRMLHQCNYTSADLWKYVKPMVREKQSSNGVLIFDDTIEEKAYMDENAMICWHYDHCYGTPLISLKFIEIVGKSAILNSCLTGEDSSPRLAANTPHRR